MSRFFLGIDPGFTGAVAVYCPEAEVVNVGDMPTFKDPSSGKTLINDHALFEMLRPSVGNIHGMLEKVASRPGQSAPSTFRFGEGFGAIKMALAGHQIPYQTVTPAKWKKHFGLSKDKRASRGLATQRFPGASDLFKRVKDDGRAEAALLALYAWETSKA